MITVQAEHNGRFTVKKWDKYPAHSVLAGQDRKSFVGSYDTYDEAKEAHPDAVDIHEMMQPVNTFDHL